MKPPVQIAPLKGRACVLLLVGVLCLGWSNLCQGVDFPLRWRWSNPRPHGANIVDMAVGGSGLAIQVAEAGQIFSSADLNLWIPRASGTSNDLRAVTFLGGRILITGANGTVLYADAVDDFRPGTLITGATADWLEAVASSASLGVAVGDNGAIYTSTNGVYWRRQTSGTAEWLRGVTFGGGVWVAVGENGRILRSVNGTNWSSQVSGAAHFNRVSYMHGRFTAVAEGGAARFSTNNAVTWYAETTGASGDLFNALSIASGTRLVVGDSEVRSQEPPDPWVNELARTNGPSPWTYYANIRMPDFCMIGGRTGLMGEGYTPTNGGFAGWIPSDDSVRPWLWDVTSTTNLYVAVGDRASVLSSVNGVDWKLELVPDAVTNSIFLGVGGTTNLLVTVGHAGSVIISPNVVSNQSVTNVSGTNITITNVVSSSFGVVWHAMTVPTTNDLQGVAASSNLVIATGANGTIITSPDGTNWTLRAAPTNRFLSSVTAWPGGWVATGDDGAILTSANGMTWNLVPPPTTNWLYRVRYLGGKLVTVGQNGVIYTSSNAVNWIKQTSGTTKWINDVVWVDDWWFAVGNSGTVLASSNTVNWSSIGTLTRKNLYGAATDGRQLIAAGTEGAILRSQVRPDLTPITILSYDRLVVTNLPSTKIAYNIYLFGGRADQQFTLDYRGGFETNAAWMIGPPLEFFDGSGTLFYLETITSTNLPPLEFYRATLTAPK